MAPASLETHAAPQESASMWAVLRVRNFRLLWLGEAISMLGDQVYLVALPWLVLQLSNDPLAMGTVLALAGIPRAIFMLVGGVLTDRYSPRTIMLISNLLRMMLVGAMAVLIFAGGIGLGMIYGFALIFGLIDAFFWPAAVSIVPQLLPTKQLQAGNSITQGTAQLALLVGPLLAGGTIAALGGEATVVDGVRVSNLTGIGYAIAFDAVTFFLSAFTLWLIRMPTGTARPHAQPPAKDAVKPNSVL
ncbi:MAG: MFS transporter, partial [Caldilineaceae bacterium]|nr:MFS transporter [Caldilineaceae bacterium]